jgi:hypothetical protein
MMKRENVRDAVMGALFMMVLMSFGTQMSPEHQQAVALKKLKAECERDLPRSETCVFVALPQSKD